MITKTIGKAEGNDVRINKPDVSSFHAKVSFDGTFFIIEDNDSTNGTYVNGHPIHRATVTANDEVRLSADTILNLPRIFGLGKSIDPPPIPNDNNFSEAFQNLKPVWEKYKADMSRERKKEVWLRGLVTVSPLLLWVVFQELYIENLSAEEKVVWQNKYIFFSVGLSTVGNLLLGNSDKSNERKTEIDENFLLVYVCPNPKCRASLGRLSWTHWSKKGHCPQCKAKYSAS